MAQDGLGPDPTLCVGEFIDAVKAQILADPSTPAEEADRLVANLDTPEVRRNFVPLGRAVYQIVTQRAAPVSSAADDAPFWDWVGQAAVWMTAMATWRSGVNAAFSAWAPGDATSQSLRNAVLAVASPGPAPVPAPASLRGRVT